jgi:hypothetical protein
MEVLDLRFNGKLNREVNNLFNQISNKKRSSFNDVVSELSEPHINNIDWWVEGPASRNTYSSPFFHRYCCFFLVDSLIDSGGFRYGEIIVDSEEFAKLLKQLLSNKGQFKTVIQVRYLTSFFRRNILKRFLMYPALFWILLIRFLSARITKHLTLNKLPETPVVLVDTFMLPDYTNKDRWYGILWDSLSVNQKKEIFFVPTIVMTPVTAFFRVYRNLRTNERNFLIKEDYLKLSDIFWAFGIRRRLNFFLIGPLNVSGYDFSGIAKSELMNNSDVLTVIESLLTYRFINRLSHAKIQIRLSIDWFEGHVLDKAWNLGFNRYYPGVKRMGYRGCGNFSLFLCSFPILLERKAGVIPDIFAVPGKGFVRAVKEFLQDADVVVVPALRSQHVWQNTILNSLQIPFEHSFIILVAFPIDIKMTNKILKTLLDAFVEISMGNKKVRYELKLHPACSVDEQYKKLATNLPDSFLLTSEKSFPTLLRQADLLISEASGTCLEALAMGTPVIVFNNDQGLSFDPIPESIPKHLYRNIISKEQLTSSIEFYVNSSLDKKNDQKSYGNWVKENYFEPITTDGINKLLNI